MARSRGAMARPLMQREIETAIMSTKSAAQAARWLDVSYPTFKKYAKLYGLLETCKNQSGRGISRILRKGTHGLDAIFAGQHPNYNRYFLKERLIAAGYLPEECILCGYKQKRVLDGRVPLTIICKDGNNSNLALENLDLRCYNCTFQTTGKVSDLTVAPVDLNTDLLSTGRISMDEIARMQQEILDEMNDD